MPLQIQFFDKDAKRFWHDVYKVSNTKATLAADVGGAVGDSNISAMWKEHFESLYSEKFVQARKDEFLVKLESLISEECMSVMFSVSEVTNAISQLKAGIAAGPHGISVEVFKYGGHKTGSLSHFIV